MRNEQHNIENESLAAKVLREEAELKAAKELCIDTTISSYDAELSRNGEMMVRYMKKYLDKNDSIYNKMLELEKNPEIRNEFCEREWALIVEQAWIISYRKAMDDEYISLEERHELNNLYSLGVRFRNNIYSKPQLRQTVSEQFKVLHALDNKYATENIRSNTEIISKQIDTVPHQTRFYKRLPNVYPKLTPWDRNDGVYGYR